MAELRIGSPGMAAALLAVILCSECAQSQKNVVRVGTGTVSGQVSCADTNAPARFAVVVLEPVPDAKGRTGGEQTATTDLEGRFVLEKVPVGRYYLLGSLSGYVNPLAGFDAKQLTAMEETTQKELAKLVPVVTVETNQATSVTLRLEHAAEVSGTVLYDDGSPAVGIRMQLLHKEADGELVEVKSELIHGLSIFGSDTFTDDRGRYRLIGAPAGKYTLKATLPAMEITVGGLLGGSGSSVSVHNEQSAQFSVYLGGQSRSKSAKMFELGHGEQVSELDFTIAVAGLHSVRGTVTALRDGHGLDNGTVELLYADDREVGREAHLEEDGSFEFSFVPEDMYIAHVKDAEDSERVEEHPNPSTATTHLETRRFYAETEVPLVVQGDVSGVSLVVKDAVVKAAAQR